MERLRVGCKVVLKDLAVRNFNGCEGVVTGYNNTLSRYEVETPNGKSMLLKRENLGILSGEDSKERSSKQASLSAIVRQVVESTSVTSSSEDSDEESQDLERATSQRAAPQNRIRYVEDATDRVTRMSDPPGGQIANTTLFVGERETRGPRKLRSDPPGGQIANTTLFVGERETRGPRKLRFGVLLLILASLLLPWDADSCGLRWSVLVMCIYAAFRPQLPRSVRLGLLLLWGLLTVSIAVWQVYDSSFLNLCREACSGMRDVTRLRPMLRRRSELATPGAMSPPA